MAGTFHDSELLLHLFNIGPRSINTTGPLNRVSAMRYASLVTEGLAIVVDHGEFQEIKITELGRRVVEEALRTGEAGRSVPRRGKG
jgi:hypothetical protein